MTLARFRARFNATRRAVDSEGRLTSEFSMLIDELLRSFDSNSDTANTDITAVDTIADAAQTAADNAARTSSYAVSVPSAFVWNSDDAGSFLTIGDPTENIVTTFYDQQGTQVAQRTLTGTINTATGGITVTDAGSSASAGYSTAYILIDDGMSSVLAEITLTLPDASTFTHVSSWNAVDIASAGGTPITGGGK